MFNGKNTGDTGPRLILCGICVPVRRQKKRLKVAFKFLSIFIILCYKFSKLHPTYFIPRPKITLLEEEGLVSLSFTDMTKAF